MSLSMSSTSSAMTAQQSMRLNAVASNLANADSVSLPDGKPYRAKQQVVLKRRRWRPARLSRAFRQVVDDAAPGRMVYHPKNPGADEKGCVDDAERQRGRGNDQHDFRLTFLPDQRRGHEHGRNTMLLRTLASAKLTGDPMSTVNSAPAPTT